MVIESVPGALATGSQLIARIRDWRDGYPVATTTPRGLPARGPRFAPGTDLIPLVWSHEVEVPSRAFNHQSIRIVFIILASKLSMIHESEVYAPAGLFIQG